jgi:PAS domain S-box-containing protein
VDPNDHNATIESLREALAAATRRAEQAEQTLEAIYAGAADAIIVPARSGPQIFILDGADRPYREIVELMAQGMAVCDPKGRIIQANDALADLIGRPADPVRGQPISELFDPDSIGHLEALIEAVRSGADRVENEVLRLIGRGALPRPASVGVSALDLDGLDAFLLTMADLSHQKRDDELLASERLARSIIDQAVDAIIVCDVEGRVLRASREAHRLCRGNPLLRRFEEAFPLAFTEPGELAPPAGDVRFGSPPLPLDQLFGDAPIRNREVTLTAGGHRDFLMLNCGPIRDELGQRLAYLVTLTDITPTKLAGERLLEADRRKDEFLAILAHELRNPLAAMAYGVALLRKEADGEGDREQDVLPLLERQVSQMRWMVDDLLDVARVEQGRIALRPEAVDLAELARQAARTVLPAVEARGHELTEEVVPGPIWVHGDPTRLEQVLVNLLSNAVKYTPPGGRIRLEVGPDPIEEGCWRVSVEDNGLGLSPEMRGRVFNLFAQAERSLDRKEGGLGIGLTLVRRLVELHGGSVEVDSPGPGQGSTFLVRLPASAPPEPIDRADTTAEGDAGEMSGPGRHVLLVDDNRDLVGALARLLRAEGHRVDLAHDGPSGLEVAERLRPEVLVLDIGLPGLDGFELARRLQLLSWMASRRLISLSGYGGLQDRDRAIASGFDEHLTKPVDVRVLDRLIRQAPLPRPGLEPREDGRGHREGTTSTIESGAGPARSACRVLLVEDQQTLAEIARRVLERVGHVVEVVPNVPMALEFARRFRPNVILCDLHLDGSTNEIELERAVRLEPELVDARLIALTGRDSPDTQGRGPAPRFGLHLIRNRVEQ